MSSKIELAEDNARKALVDKPTCAALRYSATGDLQRNPLLIKKIWDTFKREWEEASAEGQIFKNFFEDQKASWVKGCVPQYVTEEGEDSGEEDKGTEESDADEEPEPEPESSEIDTISLKRSLDKQEEEEKATAEAQNKRPKSASPDTAIT